MPGDATPPPELPPGLLAEYLESARSQLAVLAGLAERLAAAGGDREALEALRHETHKVHGSAGSYGFMEASRLAAGMEATVKDWVARPDDADVERGSLARWFVKRLGELLGVEGLEGESVFAAVERDRPGAYRVVFTTVHGTEEEQLRGLEAGALDYLVKPISLRVALEKIKRWVGR